MDFRHEWKHVINFADLRSLRQRLLAVAKPDAHAKLAAWSYCDLEEC